MGFVSLLKWTVNLQIANSMVSTWQGPPAMKSLFTRMFCCKSCPNIVKTNNFINFQSYFLQKVPSFVLFLYDTFSSKPCLDHISLCFIRPCQWLWLCSGMCRISVPKRCSTSLWTSSSTMIMERIRWEIGFAPKLCLVIVPTRTLAVLRNLESRTCRMCCYCDCLTVQWQYILYALWFSLERFSNVAHNIIVRMHNFRICMSLNPHDACFIMFKYCV